MRVVHLCRKPVEGSVAKNALEHGTGGLNIDECRIGTASGEVNPSIARRQGASNHCTPGVYKEAQGQWACRTRPEVYATARPGESLGRWPANVIFQHLPGCRCVGMRKVLTDGHYPAARGPGGLSTTGHCGQENLEERYTGQETVDAWECAEGCPVRELDGQSGATRSSGGGGVKAPGRNGIYGKFNGCEFPPQLGYGDQGGASRFFKQVGGVPKCE